MTIAAHTNAVGYHKREVYRTYSYGPAYQEFGSLSQSGSRQVVEAVSNKSATIKSNGVSSTPYFRKVGKITSLANPRVKTSSHKYEANSSIVYRGITMYGAPHGSFYSGASVSLPGWMTDQVIQNAMLELEGNRANIMEDLGQTRQTVDLCWSIFREIVNLFKFYWRHRRNPWKAFKTRKKRRPNGPISAELASHWLAFYYGVKPLVSTLEAVFASSVPRNKTISTRKRAATQVSPHVLVDPKPSIQCLSGKLEQRAQCGLTVKVSLSDTLAYWHSLGLSGPGGYATDLDGLVLIWALAPWSFVVDWILPVERFLRTRQWSSGIVYQTGYVSKTLTGHGTFVDFNPMTGSGDSGILPKVRVDCHQFERLAYNHFVPPSSLSLNVSLNTTQAFNAIALILQRA